MLCSERRNLYRDNSHLQSTIPRPGNPPVRGKRTSTARNVGPVRGGYAMQDVAPKHWSIFRVEATTTPKTRCMMQVKVWYSTGPRQKISCYIVTSALTNETAQMPEVGNQGGGAIVTNVFCAYNAECLALAARASIGLASGSDQCRACRAGYRKPPKRQAACLVLKGM